MTLIIISIILIYFLRIFHNFFRKPKVNITFDLTELSTEDLIEFMRFLPDDTVCEIVKKDKDNKE